VQPQGEPEEREPRLARRSPFALETKLCPKCLGPLKTQMGLPGILPSSYYCPKCGYSGIVYIAKEPSSDKGKP
jgi:hypothetical protein